MQSAGENKRVTGLKAATLDGMVREGLSEEETVAQIDPRPLPMKVHNILGRN